MFYSILLSCIASWTTADRCEIFMPKRPRDTNQLAKMVVDMTTGQAENDSLAEPAGRAKGGLARAKNLDAERRRQIAKQGAKARWGADKAALSK